MKEEAVKLGNEYLIKMKDSRNIICVSVTLVTKDFFRVVDVDTLEVIWAAKSDFGFTSDGFRVKENVTSFFEEK